LRVRREWGYMAFDIPVSRESCDDHRTYKNPFRLKTASANSLSG
jgi:hypothetical protein